MKNSIFRSILIGLLIGFLFFIAGKFILILLIIGAIFKLSGRGRRKREQWITYKLSYADKIRNMEDIEYEDFKSDFGKNDCDHQNI